MREGVGDRVGMGGGWCGVRGAGVSQGRQLFCGREYEQVRKVLWCISKSVCVGGGNVGRAVVGERVIG